MRFDGGTSTGLENQPLGGHKQNLRYTRIQEKGAVTPQEVEPDLSVSVQELPEEGSEVEGDTMAVCPSPRVALSGVTPMSACGHCSL